MESLLAVLATIGILYWLTRKSSRRVVNSQKEEKTMKHRKLIALTMIVGLTFTVLWGTSPTFGAEQGKLALQCSQEVE